VLVVVVAMLAPRAAGADSRVQFLAERLKNDDFRVRASAALALGNTNDDGAVTPLCGAIDDSSDVVRKAIAAALERLKRSSSLSCLKQRLASESVAAVKLQLQRAIDAVESGGSGGGNSGGSSVPSGAKFYVSLSPVNNNSSRANSEIDNVIHGAIRSRLTQLGGYAHAPVGESVASAKAAIAKHNLKGYHLAISLDKFDYSGGGLRIKVKIAVFSYPDKDLKGELTKGASIGGVRPGDTSSEDQLMNAVAAAAAESFSQAFK
jgi:hypothetical protein